MYRKVLSFIVVVSVLSSSFNLAGAQTLVSSPDRRMEKADPLKKTYLGLRIGMTFTEVRDLAELYYPSCKLENTDIWASKVSNVQNGPFFSWVFGMDGKEIKVEGNISPLRSFLHRVTLRLDFDKELKLINAVYVRSDKKDFKKIKKNSKKFALKAEERLALVGDGYYR